MRIFFQSMTLPKKAAKRIQKQFSPSKVPNRKIDLSFAQLIAANMLGYSNWHELEQVSKSKLTPSLTDEFVSEEEQTERISFQANVLRRFLPYTEPLLQEIALELRVSAGNPSSLKFSEDHIRDNKVFHWIPPGFLEKPEWRFRPSKRSAEIKNTLWDLLDTWSTGQLNFVDYQESLEATIKEQPENVTAQMYLLDAAGNIDALQHMEKELTRAEETVLNCLPVNYPLNKKVDHFNWYTHDNRDFLRLVFHLAYGHYVNGKYRNAKKWFLFLKRCSDVFEGEIAPFLDDLKLNRPTGKEKLND